MRKNEYGDYRSVITESWDRCIAQGLEHEDQPSPTAQTPKGADTTGETTELLAMTEAEVLPYYRNVLSSSRCLILLADRQANILRSWGDDRITEAHLKPWFEDGANWHEQTCGTNAIGTCIATGKPVQIERNEHFLKLHRSLIGSAAPIFDATKTLAGALSVFSDAYLPRAHTLGMVRLLSQSVENRLISRHFEHSHCQITLNTTADNFDSPWSGILVCNDRGMIISSNQRADQLLGQDTMNRRLDDLFTTPRNHILAHPERMPMQLVTRSKVRLSARLKRPASRAEPDARFAPEKSEQAPSIAQPDLTAIEFGDASVRRCASQAFKVLERGVPLLITGETGVGKEILVKALHGASHRKHEALVSVNCAAIPPELVESELFGYQPGAFTGARAQGSLGFIRKAHKGILFLDEIGEMPLSAQSRLLRVLQEREVTPVGSTDSVSVDLLLVTATNRSLASRIEAGQFRTDLYYRINGLSVELPPLRYRADKRELIREIYREHRESGQPDELSPSVLAALENHPWPGNIRQLVNVLRVAIAIADGEDIQVWHLPEDFLAQLDDSESSLAAPASEAMPALRDTDHDAETAKGRDPLARTLRVYHQCMGNISRTARELSISRNTLYKRLRELGVR
ncbi:sigma-54-dependent Fis family transcriptional regulator [Marinobacter arenosus]|uniref:sigma-54-dependent Fis family transcriptional regulator n=1 Tax=Marinobacter arenosus TaxID=2856822 RepID=UPI001C4B4554|nr:sigma-54-dependent Fis family transcriptional regulator [Marinobacter arenosus]MBW0146609.1 sigma-54-dependent Fis family transcriptional regulator [Marinobacter arenosus]